LSLRAVVCAFPALLLLPKWPPWFDLRIGYTYPYATLGQLLLRGFSVGLDASNTRFGIRGAVAISWANLLSIVHARTQSEIQYPEWGWRRDFRNARKKFQTCWIHGTHIFGNPIVFQICSLFGIVSALTHYRGGVGIKESARIQRPGMVMVKISC